jgi:hypothetical protein
VTAQEIYDLIKNGGALGAAVVVIWALLTRRIITRGEFNSLETRFNKMEALNEEANDELRKQSSTNARLVELSFQQRQEAENIRRLTYPTAGGNG